MRARGRLDGAGLESRPLALGFSAHSRGEPGLRSSKRAGSCWFGLQGAISRESGNAPRL